jgi:hypothetical protein
MKVHYYICKVSALWLVMLGSALATTSVVQVSVEGNATCSSLATNTIKQAKDTNYTPNASGFDSVTGTDGQVFSYKISPSNILAEWQITNPPGSSAKPVNFIILKLAGKAGAKAFYFGSTGALTDMTATVATNIVAVSFCYGLTPHAPTASLTSCSDPAAIANLGDLTEVCNADPTRVVTIFDESTPNWRVQTCSCGSTFTECNPDLQAGTPGACTNSEGSLQFMPIEVQLGRDPDSYYCTVISGTRRCYKK